MPETEVLRFTTRLSQSDLVWMSAHFARGSTVFVAVGALIVGSASAAVLFGDTGSLFFVLLGLALGQTYQETWVLGGRIESTASVADWPAGRGLAVAYFWVDGRQPAAVIDRFGRDGAGLRGGDVVDDPRNGRTLEVSAPFETGP